MENRQQVTVTQEDMDAGFRRAQLYRATALMDAGMLDEARELLGREPMKFGFRPIYFIPPKEDKSNG